MGHSSSRSCGGYSGTAGVSEEVQYLHGAACLMDQTGEPVPVHSLLREQTGMFETEGLQMEGQRISLTGGFLLKRQGVMNRPFIRQMEELPFSAALAASVIMAVFLFPARIFFFRVPDDLRVWSYQKVISPPLQFFSAGRIQHFIIFPSICYPHFIGFLSLLSQNLSCSELYVPMIP